MGTNTNTPDTMKLLPADGLYAETNNAKQYASLVPKSFKIQKQIS